MYLRSTPLFRSRGVIRIMWVLSKDPATTHCSWTSFQATRYNTVLLI